MSYKHLTLQERYQINAYIRYVKQKDIANMYNYGIGTDINQTKAFEIYQLLCDKNQSSSCYSLGLLYYNSIEIKKDIKYAGKLFKKACDLGSENGCKNYRILRVK